MRLGRPLARLWAAMIVMIVAYLAPSVAEAHAGHHHASVAVVAAFDALPSPEMISAASQVAPTASAVPFNVEAAEVLTAAGSDDPAPFKRCTGPCCCNISMACCAHALTADTGGAALITPASRLAAIPDDLALQGIDPETLPEPPRTFA